VDLRISDNGKRSDSEQAAQVTIALFGDAAQSRFASSEADLTRDFALVR
jgi:hypothetical protein